MTDKKFASLREPARKEADRIVALKSVDSVSEHMKNIAGEIAKAMLRQWGWYGCILNHANGTKEKVFFELVA